MACVYRINAIIAYTDGSSSSYTSAFDQVQHSISGSDFSQTELEVFAWPSFREWLEANVAGISLATPIDISHVADIVWYADIENDPDNVSAFEDKNGSVGVSTNIATITDELCPEFSAVVDRNESAPAPPLPAQYIDFATVGPDITYSRVLQDSFSPPFPPANELIFIAEDDLGGPSFSSTTTYAFLAGFANIINVASPISTAPPPKPWVISFVNAGPSVGPAVFSDLDTLLVVGVINGPIAITQLGPITVPALGFPGDNRTNAYLTVTGDLFLHSKHVGGVFTEGPYAFGSPGSIQL